MHIEKTGKMLLFISDLHNFPMVYYTMQFRKRSNSNRLSVLRNCWKRAKLLESQIKSVDQHAKTLFEAKKQVYSIRYDLNRCIDSVIHPIIESKDQVSLQSAWSLVMQGLGHSIFTGKRVKPITCKEKQVKVLKRFIELLSANKA